MFRIYTLKLYRIYKEFLYTHDLSIILYVTLKTILKNIKNTHRYLETTFSLFTSGTVPEVVFQLPTFSMVAPLFTSPFQSSFIGIAP